MNAPSTWRELIETRKPRNHGKGKKWSAFAMANAVLTLSWGLIPVLFQFINHTEGRYAFHVCLIPTFHSKKIDIFSFYYRCSHWFICRQGKWVSMVQIFILVVIWHDFQEADWFRARLIVSKCQNRLGWM